MYKITYTDKKGAYWEHNHSTRQEMNNHIERLFKRRIECTAIDDDGECGAVFRRFDDNRWSYYYWNRD